MQLHDEWCDQKQPREFAGKLLRVSSNTRPVMAFEVCMMHNTFKSPTMKKMVETNKAITMNKSRTL